VLFSARSPADLVRLFQHANVFALPREESCCGQTGYARTDYDYVEMLV
jgi:hypothetical protein